MVRGVGQRAAALALGFLVLVLALVLGVRWDVVVEVLGADWTAGVAAAVAAGVVVVVAVAVAVFRLLAPPLARALAEYQISHTSLPTPTRTLALTQNLGKDGWRGVPETDSCHSR